MSEKQRLDLAHAIFYVELKSNAHRSLFTDRESFLQFEALLQQLFEETGATTLGYCLLQETVHLVLNAGDEGIKNDSRWLTQAYTKFYNDHHQRNGSVFNNRSHTLLLEPRRYLLAVIRQLHQLPVTAQLVAAASIYPWSSHHHYQEDRHADWFESQPLINLVGNQRHNWRRRYEQAMTTATGEFLDWHGGNHDQVIALASDHYVTSLLAAQDPQVYQAPTLEWLKGKVCDEYTLDDQDLALWRRHRLAGEVKAVIAALAIQFESSDLPTAAEFLQEDPDVLEGGIRALNTHRSLFLHNLQLQLQTELYSRVNPEQEPPLLQPAES
ncbi:MAG: hypothetical protein AseanaTS_00820 [Candidatus Pelagadaptatus aseana]|uniref:transposase n=1 Tax=Candidatus Pelagadaptatus aseana TaxID=3120508 RepID=UPI0039B17E2D